MTKKIAIVGSGKLSEKFLKGIKQADSIIGVDRGAAWLLSHNIIPHVAVGDFDSVTKKEFQLIEKKVQQVIKQPPYPKYETDMELAVQHALKQNPNQVAIYGATGTRIDHMLGSLYLLEQFLKTSIDARIVDETNEIILVSGRRTLKKVKGYRYVSVLPFTKSAIVTLRGFLYEVDSLTIHQGQTVGISNEIPGIEATIEVHEGIVWVIQSKD